MSLNKRERRANGRVSVTEYPQLTFGQAIDLVIGAKKSEGIRDRTIDDYRNNFRYFTNWLMEFHPQLNYISEIVTTHIHDHVNYMRYGQIRYGDHKFIDPKKQRIGLSDTTVNIRLRTLRAILISYYAMM